MVITLPADLAGALSDLARKQGVDLEVLAVNALRERFLNSPLQVQPQDEWGRGPLTAASDCGASLSNEAVSSEGLYE
jgi:hypothetical protein